MTFQDPTMSTIGSSTRDSRSLIIDVNEYSDQQENSPVYSKATSSLLNVALNHSSPEQRILSAIRHDDLAAFIKLLDMPNMTGQHVSLGKLMFNCCEHGRSEMLRRMLKLDLNLNQTYEESITCLMETAKKNHIDCMMLLLTNGAKVNMVDNFEWSALMYASYYGHLESVGLLLDAGAFVNVFDMDHMSSLIWASGRGHLEVVKLLLKFGAKVDASDKYGTTPLIWACRKGHNEVVECLIQVGANVNATGMFGWSALLTTVRGNYLETTKILLRQGNVNVNTCDSQRLSPLMIASKDGLVDIAKLLIEKDAFVNLSDRYGHTALIHATKSGHKEIVEILINAKADIDHIGFDKKSATFWATEKGYIEVLRTLLKVNPNLEIITNDGETCLIRAVKLRRYDIISLLLAHGAKVSATDKYGDTVLHTAVRIQSKTIVELLLANPKNCQLIYKPNKKKETPFSIDQNNPRHIFPALFDDFETKKATLFPSPRPQHTVNGNQEQLGLHDHNTDEPSNKSTPLQCINLMSHAGLANGGSENKPPAQMRHRTSTAAIEPPSNLLGRQLQHREGLSERRSNRSSIDSMS